MRIRTQLILAAFVLAVIPLAAIVTYSYHSSRRALESAYRREADRLNKQMDRRLAAIRADLDQRLTVVSSLALPVDGGSAEAGNNIATVMGEAASLVDSLEFQPVRVAEPDDVAAEADVEVADAESSGAAAASASGSDIATPAPPPEPGSPGRRATTQVASLAPAPPAPAPPQGPIVIDLPPMAHVPRYVMSEEQRELISEIGRLGAALGNRQLDPEEREDIRNELRAAQEELRSVVAASRDQYNREIREAQMAHRERQRQFDLARNARVAAAPAVAPTPAVQATPKVAQVRPVQVRKVTKKDIEKARVTAQKTSLILGRKFEAPVRKEGELVGQITARISPDQVIRRVLGNPTEDSTEIPFAVDREGTIYTRNEEERTQLHRLGIVERLRDGRSLRGIEGWIVTASTDQQSGLRIGVARPVGDNLDELRRTAARNFSLGMGLIAFALIGIVPLSNHLTRDVKLVTDGAERIAQGDLMTRLPVKTKNELGQLARAFNRMAEDLSHHQQRLLEQERARKAQELQQALLSVEYERKSVELEEARRFQLSMLPKEVPRHPAYDVAVYTRTATEVGGDYYDFHLDGDVLSVTIGDATGHGAKAGTMVTVIKTLFAGYQPDTAPSAFLRDAAERIKRMDLGRMAMALSVARIEGRGLTLSSAGMPPVLVHRAELHRVDEVSVEAPPLGTIGSEYEERHVELAPGDTVLFLTDGFPELMNDAGQQLGYGAALDAFADAAKGATAEEAIAALASFSARWHGDAAPNDDVTFVVVRVA
jgi:serine phosphatase RsbU (regulator of sigma subunit)